jgi:membrane-bound metal-dependent hydrolase YbcI (DUF457 family)
MVGLAVLPDIDLLFGFVQGAPNAYHHQATHSLVFVLVSALVVTAILNIKKRTQFWRSFVFLFGAGLSHLLIDLLTLDTSFPYGLMFWWPFDSGYVIAPVTLFLDVHRSSLSSDFWISLISRHNFITLTIEIALMSVLYGVVVGVQTWNRR